LNNFIIRPTSDEDKKWITDLLTERWGSHIIVTRGRVHYGDQLPGFIAEYDNARIGLVTYHIENKKCEIVTLDSITERIGMGSNLLEEVKKLAKSSGCEKIWLVTTNDNLYALRFYQKRGFDLVAIYPGAVIKSRELKHEIPMIGFDGIEIKDEIELEMKL
jgi:N-acetylglutamate synthase-like GNAT family acetyltransferase